MYNDVVWRQLVTSHLSLLLQRSNELLLFRVYFTSKTLCHKPKAPSLNHHEARHRINPRCFLWLFVEPTCWMISYTDLHASIQSEEKHARNERKETTDNSSCVFPNSKRLPSGALSCSWGYPPQALIIIHAPSTKKRAYKTSCFNVFRVVICRLQACHHVMYLPKFYLWRTGSGTTYLLTTNFGVDCSHNGNIAKFKLI